MAAEMKPENQTVKNLQVDPPPKLGDSDMACTKDGSPSDVTSCISSFGEATGSVKEGDVDQESLMAEQGMYYPPGSYYGYYYPGYDGYPGYGEWEDQGYFLSSDGLNIHYPAIQADDGSLHYYVPGFQSGYMPYSPYSPGATVGIDGQYLGQQPYFSSPIFPHSITSPGYTPTHPHGAEVFPSYLWDPSVLVGDGFHGNFYAGVPTIPGSESNFLTPNQTFAPMSKSNKPLEMKGTPPSSNVTPGHSMLNQLKPANKGATIMAKGYYPVTKFPTSNKGKGDSVYPDNPVSFKANGRGWESTERLKARRADGISDFVLLNEQNCGPRTNNAQDSFVEHNGSCNSSDTVVRRDQYNLPDFPTKYDNALFFIIKSYSEDDIHKSIKYNVWASTPNGNKRLDSAYEDAQKKMGERGNPCPVFLFFSVNASGQFCGVAEMIGRVDFGKNLDFWQQDKWNGSFPVKWHIIKDVPNMQFRHIILENNENKPVTNSRDTQEVRFSKGIEMLNIFKSYLSNTSILDDFSFYESRQKAMQDRRTRVPALHLNHLQPKVDEVSQITSSFQLTNLTDIKKNNNEELMVAKE